MKTAKPLPDESARTDSTCHSNESAGTDSRKISYDTAGTRDSSSDAISSLSDENLLKRIDSLNARERRTMLTVLLHLGELDLRRLYLGLGYGSLFDFCVRRLGYSESAAGRRVRTARCLRDFPEIAGMLLSGEMNLSTVSKISGVITKENCRSVLEKVRGRSYREVEMLVSRFDPRAAVKDRVKPVYVRTVLVEPKIVENEPGDGKEKSPSGKSSSEAEKGSGSSPGSGREFTADVGGKKSARLFGEGRVHEVLEERYRLEFAVDAGFMEKLERVKSLLSARHPEGLGFERLFGLLMDGYIDRHSPEARRERRAGRAERKKRKASAGRGEKDGRKKIASADGCMKDVRRNRKASAVVHRKPAASRHIPRAVRDEVYARDGGCCTFVGPGGRRCGSRWNLEIDHIVPFERGGDNSKENLRLLCAKHNLDEAERVYGRSIMDRFIRGR